MDDLDQKLTEFSVTVYGEFEKFNDVTSKARCRIFYKGANRNGSYITDEFAEELLKTIPYTPVKGIYEVNEGDYTDHGQSRNLGRIYGIVPENPNTSWEKFVDEDGVEREYACVDVLLFTALYNEAQEIIGKAQSMELYRKSIEGEWQFIDGQKVYVFSKACFLGLQVLGDATEPCFEGAGFFSLYNSLTDMIKKIEQYNLNLQNVQTGGDKYMPEMIFKISDDQKYSMLWTLLNPNYNEEGNWTVNYVIQDVFDKYAIVYNRESENFERAYYTKNDETDSLSVDKFEVCYIVDVTESEYKALQAVQALNQGTYEKLDEVFTDLSEKNTEFESKIEELNTSIATLTTERDEAVTQYTEANNLLAEAKTALETAQTEYTTLQTERDQLFAFKEQVELAQKQSTLDSYASLLDETILAAYTEKIGEYTNEELDKELAYELKKHNPAVFNTTTPAAPIVIPTVETPVSGVEEILNKYIKK